MAEQKSAPKQKESRVKVRSLIYAGKSVNLPHLEHREGGSPAAVTFGDDGFAMVSKAQADALLEFYPRAIEMA